MVDDGLQPVFLEVFVEFDGHFAFNGLVVEVTPDTQVDGLKPPVVGLDVFAASLAILDVRHP
ncbi:hypothetical protein [Halomarina oriensis]|uniref:Uncharacterized protein n=1 Tax=Halomarina oriensis TaxID=671145 RepID=A0A6B0GTD3_9EURY|nr:hypothetical protein [Halomarina oriensis]MWG35395.1 hypothetical protein [Halomarina oriensis]